MGDDRELAIIGATGQVGRAACNWLRAKNQPFVALLRSPDLNTPQGGQRYADMDRPESLDTALAGVRRLLLCGPDHPNLVQREAAVVAAAKSAGVELLIKLSAQCGILSPPAGFGKRHALAERGLQKSGLPYLILSPMFFSQSVFLFGDKLKDGRLRYPLTAGRVCYVDAEDVGQAAANCLLDPPAQNRRYILSGPQSLSVDGVLAILSEEIGRPVRNSAPPKSLLPFILPLVAGLNYSESVLLKELLIVLDENAQCEPTPSLRELLGRPPADFARVARRWAGTPAA